VHLRDAHHASDFGLTEIAEIPKYDDVSLALVERVHSRRDHRLGDPLLVDGIALREQTRVLLLDKRHMGSHQLCQNEILLDAARDPHNRAQVSEMPANLALNAGRCIGRELRDALGVAAIDGPDQPDRADLNQILEAFPAAGEAPRNPSHQRKMSLDQPTPRQWIAQIGPAVDCLIYLAVHVVVA